MTCSRLPHRIFALVLAVATSVLCAAASADPPERVARLAYLSGAVSFSPAGEEDWVVATLNRPLTTGDRLWTDAGARAELQLGSATVRLDQRTSADVLALDDRRVQVELAQGTLRLDVRRLERDDIIEIDTPNLAFTIERPGSYRIDVDANGATTAVGVRRGEGEVQGEGARYAIGAGTWYRFGGTELLVEASASVAAPDVFERWADGRERTRGVAAARYVAPDVIGADELDVYGTWRAVPEYGNVWLPRNVAVDWAPYRYGHWAWIEPWGWTWIDDAPWGFAPFHYGRWVLLGGSWAWVPGPVSARPVYAPALVAFVGGAGFSLTLSTGAAGVAWFPLAPHEVYRPAYQTSEAYFTRLNISNTTVNTTVVTNVYRNTTNVTNITYVNRQVAQAITAVPTTTFAQARPVRSDIARVDAAIVARAPVVETAAVAPRRSSLFGTAPDAQAKPSAAVLRRAAVVRTAPPPEPASFAERQSALASNPGRPAAESTTEPKRPRNEGEQRRVKVVGAAPASNAAPGATPPAAPPPPQTTARSSPSPSADRRDPGDSNSGASAPARGRAPASPQPDRESVRKAEPAPPTPRETSPARVSQPRAGPDPSEREPMRKAEPSTSPAPRETTSPPSARVSPPRAGPDPSPATAAVPTAPPPVRERAPAPPAAERAGAPGRANEAAAPRRDEKSDADRNAGREPATPRAKPAPPAQAAASAADREPPAASPRGRAPAPRAEPVAPETGAAKPAAEAPRKGQDAPRKDRKQNDQEDEKPKKNRE